MLRIIFWFHLPTELEVTGVSGPSLIILSWIWCYREAEKPKDVKHHFLTLCCSFHISVLDPGTAESQLWISLPNSNTLVAWNWPGWEYKHHYTGKCGVNQIRTLLQSSFNLSPNPLSPQVPGPLAAILPCSPVTDVWASPRAPQSVGQGWGLCSLLLSWALEVSKDSAETGLDCLLCWLCLFSTGTQSAAIQSPSYSVFNTVGEWLIYGWMLPLT